MTPTRTLAPGVVVSPISLGGALLGVDAAEGAALLDAAVESGIALVDTSAAYGESEAVIGVFPHSNLLVATKFGNPCELNGHVHDYSAEHCAASAFRSLAPRRQADRRAPAALAAEVPSRSRCRRCAHGSRRSRRRARSAAGVPRSTRSAAGKLRSRRVRT